MDPKDLNKVVRRSHYPLPTIEEVATRLSNAKVFTVLDAKCGFWHVKLIYAADKFEQYIYGRTATVESDHKPLEAIWKKPIQAAPFITKTVG